MRRLADLGLDSLLSVDLRNELQAALRRPLPYALTFNYPSVAALSAYVFELLFGSGAGSWGIQLVSPASRFPRHR